MDQALARKGSKTCGSSDTVGETAELRGDKRALKLNSWDTIRVWWAPVLARGKFHIELLPADFPGDRPEGAAAFVAQVRVALNLRFQNAEDRPRVVFVDRGVGFYNPGHGRITQEFKAALADQGLKAFMGHDASAQPGHLSDLMLHETAVAWVRKYEGQTLPRRPWEETAGDFATRLKRIAAAINEDHDVEGLCRGLPPRIEKLFSRQGGKLSK